MSKRSGSTATGSQPSDGDRLQALYRAAVEALPEEVRTAFLLHRAEGQDIAAIADRMGLPSATVEDHIAHALIALIDAVDGELR